MVKVARSTNCTRGWGCNLGEFGKMNASIALKNLDGKKSADRADQEKEGSRKTCQILEVIIVIALIAFVWGLFSLPIIFYHLETDKVR